MFTDPIPFLIGMGVLFIFWILLALATGGWNLAKIVRGSDGRPSTSKLQLSLWTAVALFSYVAIYAARVTDVLSTEFLPSIPRNLLIAMGLSIATATAAKTITSSFVRSGKITKDAVASYHCLVKHRSDIRNACSGGARTRPWSCQSNSINRTDIQRSGEH